MSTASAAGSFSWFSRGVDVLCVLVAGALMLAPSSGLKSAVIWIFFLCVLVRAVRAGRHFRAGSVSCFVLLYLLACAVSTYFSVDMRFSARQLVKLIEAMALFFVLVHTLSPLGRLSRALRQAGVSIGIIATVDCIRLLFGAVQGSLELDHGRWFGSLLGYPTIAAGMYAVGFLLLLTNVTRDRSVWQRSVWCFFMLMILVLLYWLQTRSVLLGLVCGVCVFLLAGPLPVRVQSLVLAGSAAVVILFALIPGHFRDRIQRGSLSDRQAIWADAITLIDQGAAQDYYRRWVGFGYGHRIFEELHVTLAPRERQAPRVFDHAHNMMVELRIQTGWFGLVTLVGLLLSLGWAGARRCPSRKEREQRINFAGVAAAFIVLLVYAQFSLIFAYLPALMFWVLPAAYFSILASPFRHRIAG